MPSVLLALLVFGFGRQKIYQEITSHNIKKSLIAFFFVVFVFSHSITR